MCSISVEPMPSMMLDAGGVAATARASQPAALRRPRRTCAALEQIVLRRQRGHRAVRGRRGEAARSRRSAAIAASSASGRGLLEQHGRRRRTRSGNSSSPPSPKVKASGGLPMKTSSAGLQHVRREAVADRQHVAVEVHRALGLAGGAGGEGDAAPRRRRRCRRCRSRRAWPRHRASRPSAASSPNVRRSVRSAGHAARAASSSLGQRARRTARASICALSMIAGSSLARSSGMVADRDAAGLHHARTSRPPASGCWRRAAARGCRAQAQLVAPAPGRCGWRARAPRRSSTCDRATTGSDAPRAPPRRRGPTARPRH